ncbi:MAG: serine/threonine protein kinase [Candidatus Obscuribacterales bacterium]|nr:serine/threonine protein kinase [Candidatus Obscuribacterales bacterium]
MPEPKAGSIFDKRYLITRELGAGGMGLVFQATQVDANREVALKMLRIAGTDEESKARFFREFKVLSELNHPHIMTVYGLGIDSNSDPYAICEYLEGMSLRTYLAQGALDWKEAARISSEIAEALQYAHKNGVVHRDLKPENIVLVNKPYSNYVKLIDFGLARIIQEGAQKLTGTGQLLGSPLYMSPEQTRQAADNRSDIYSLGCIFFEMLSGQQLFPANEAASAIYLHSSESATHRFVAISQQVPAKLMDLLAEMLAKDPNDRCQSALAISSRLKSIIENPGQSFSHSNKQPKAMKIMVALSAMLLAALVPISVAAFMHQQKRKPVYIESAPKSFQNEINALDKEMEKYHQKQTEANIVAISHEEHTKKLSHWLERLKQLENKGRRNKDKFRVYWLESICYKKLNDYEKQNKYLLLCLELIPKRKDQRYGEVPGLLFGCALGCKNMGKLPEAKRYALAAIDTAKELDEWIAQGNVVKEMLPSGTRHISGWSVTSFGIVPTQLYLNEGNFKDAMKFAQPIHFDELKAFPHTQAGNASISGTICYAVCLAKLGNKKDAVKTVEDIVNKFNQPGDIPEDISKPHQQLATAADILKVYGEACDWFDEYEPTLAPKYRKKAAEYAKFYGLEDFWAKQ